MNVKTVKATQTVEYMTKMAKKVYFFALLFGRWINITNVSKLMRKIDFKNDIRNKTKKDIFLEFNKTCRRDGISSLCKLNFCDECFCQIELNEGYCENRSIGRKFMESIKSSVKQNNVRRIEEYVAQLKCRKHHHNGIISVEWKSFLFIQRLTVKLKWSFQPAERGLFLAYPASLSWAIQIFF